MGTRRKFGGLVVNKRTQFKIAVACSSLILVPSLVTSVTLLAELAHEVSEMIDGAVPAAQIRAVVLDHALNYGLTIVGVLTVFALASMFLSLKLSNQIIRPVHRLEAQVQGMLEDKFEKRAKLRKGDYLQNLGELLDQLADKLCKRAPDFHGVDRLLFLC